MSYADVERIWVGDLDDYISVGRDDWDDQHSWAKEGWDQDDLAAIGNLALLDGRRTSASALSAKGVTSDEWRWAVLEAEKSLSCREELLDLEGALIHGLLAIGRPYAIGRHAKWERLTLASARTAVLPFGHLALLDQQLSNFDPAGAADARRAVRTAIKKVEAAEGLVAYERTALVRTAILNSVEIQRAGKIDRERMRLLLSLTRLRFMVTEANVRSFAELRALDGLYEVARRRATTAEPVAPAGSRPIRNWTSRHLHPLTFLMPIAVRAALDRGSRHMLHDCAMPVMHNGPPRRRIEQTQAVNELALARCATILIRRAARPE